MSAEIAVLGAGLAGLAAASELTRLGHQVTVFEARKRVGGRVWSDSLHAAGGTHIIERGAEFVLAGYTALRSYCDELGLELVDTGMSYYIRVPADRPDVTTAAMEQIGRDAANAAANLPEARSVADILDEIGVSGPAREALEARIEISTAVRTEQVTADQTLEHVASFEPGPSWRILGGNQRLPEALAARLAGRIRLGSPVQTVLQTGEKVLVTTDATSSTFDYVVVALPYGVLADSQAVSIDLPEWKTRAMENVVQGNAAKLHLGLASVPTTSAVMSVSDRYWTWTANASRDEVSPVLNCFGGEMGHLLALGINSGAAKWEERVRTLRPELDLAAAPALLTAWPLDPWARGAYTAHAPAFTTIDADALSAPHGRLYFAGEYIDSEFTGLMEGALRSGMSAADAIHHVEAGTEEAA